MLGLTTAGNRLIRRPVRIGTSMGYIVQKKQAKPKYELLIHIVDSKLTLAGEKKSS